jgi:tripartite-type tricarboxylate transporter receptor subunit TctC
MSRFRIAAGLFAVWFGWTVAGVHAQPAYPSQPLKIIVPFAPGGGSDFIGRFIADKLTKSLGQPVLVDNRPGAGGLLGIEIGVKAPADGYTFILIASSYSVNPSIFKLKFDPVNDITPVAQISQGPMVLLANPGLKVKTVKELLERAKANPGEITFASAGLGSVTHMAGEYFASAAKVKLTHVPYKGTSPALTDTIAGQVNIFFSSPASALAHVESGKLVALGVTTTKPATGAVYAKVPTIASAGLPGYEAVLWHGLIGPKGVPKPIVERMNKEIAAALKNKEAVEKLETDGVAPAGGSADQFAALIKKDIALWAKVVKDGNIKVE